ncbi:amidohydrolase [Microbacterium sp.]|uniref:amidohydrolase n=1 Tax=Microbacterium sp. TaxID=51671 RepID=UPI003F9E6004
MRIDTIIENARIRTMDPRRPAASRIGILSGRVVGLDEALDGVQADRVVDLAGAAVLPGFHDAHFHLMLTGFRLAAVDVRPSVASTMDAVLDAVRAGAAGLPEGEVLHATGYDQNIIGAHPTARQLDEASGGRAVVMEHVSAHMTTVSTAVFDLIGYPGGAGVPDIPGGYVERDVEGRATGLLQENAQNLIERLREPGTQEQVARYIDLASRYALEYGLTSISEPGARYAFTAYQTARERGVLMPRIVYMPFVSRLRSIQVFDDGDGWLGFDDGIRTGLGDDRLMLGPMKIVTDGSLIGRSAAMHVCYHGESDNAGFLRYDAEELQAAIVAGHRAGWTIAAHAIGDAAIDHVLDGFEEAQRVLPRPGVRHRIEHFAVADDAQIARAAALGVIPVPQGRFISEFGDGMAKALGADRAQHCYRMRSLLDAGIVLPGSTDAPIADANPLRSIHDMVNRQTASGAVLAPDERISAYEAVHAYTVGSSYAVGQEHERGTLIPGMLADLVVLSDDVLAVEPAEIGGVSVRATMIGGEFVFNTGV